MAKMQLDPKKMEVVKKTVSVAAPTGGPGTKMPRAGQLEEVVITGQKEKPLVTVGTGTMSPVIALYPSIVKEYVDTVNPKWSKFIDTSSAESMKKSLNNLSNLQDFAVEIDKKYFKKSGNLGEIRKQAKLDVFKRNPDFNF
jgi:hypothetical protein